MATSAGLVCRTPHANLIGDVIDRVVLAPNSNTVPSLYTRLVIACTLSRNRAVMTRYCMTAFHGFIRVFKYGIGTLTCSNVLNQNLSLEKIYSTGVDG